MEEGKWSVGLNNFSFDGEHYKIDSISEKRMLITSNETASYGTFDSSIEQTIEFLVLEDDSTN